MSVLNARIKTFAHVIDSTGGFVKRFLNRVNPSTMVFVHFGIASFFNTGALDFLSRYATMLCYRDIRSIVKDALDLILDHQYVKSEIIQRYLS